MPFKTDRQRKAFFAGKGKSVSNIIPAVSGRISNIKEKLRLRQERLGRERIKKEEEALKHEQEQSKRLQKEADIEMQREKATLGRIKAQQELKEVQRERFRRSPAGKISRYAGKGAKKLFRAI